MSQVKLSIERLDQPSVVRAPSGWDALREICRNYIDCLPPGTTLNHLDYEALASGGLFPQEESFSHAKSVLTTHLIFA